MPIKAPYLIPYVTHTYIAGLEGVDLARMSSLLSMHTKHVYFVLARTL